MTELKEIARNTHIYTASNALSPDLCDDIIKRFDTATDEHYPGRVGQTEEENLSIKRSTDLVISGKDHWKDIDQALFKSLAQAMKFMQSKSVFFQNRFKDYGYAIQKTDVGEFFHWHVDSGSHSFADRQLVAIWYLNSVPGPGGETEFLHQQVSVTPEKGKLLIFPPFWTHEHRGVTLQQGVKYIATTWIMFA